MSVLEKKIIEETPELEKNQKMVTEDKKNIAAAAEEAEASGKIVFSKKEIAEAEEKEVSAEAALIDEFIKKAEPELKKAEKKIKDVDEKSISELFSYNTPSPKMFDLLDVFLELWSVKQKIVYVKEEVEVRGIKKKQKSSFKTCKALAKEIKIKDEMLVFPKDELKNNKDLMFALLPKFKAIKEEECVALSVALGAI